MHVHTWADPKMYQIWTVNQTNQNDCPKETQEKCPIKVIQTTLRAWLSNSGTLPLSLPVCLSTHQFSSVQFSRSVVSDSLQPHELQHARPPCLSQTPGVYPNPCPSSRWCHPAISSFVPPSPPARNTSQHQWISCSHEVAKVLKFQLQHQCFHWTPRTDLL